MNFTVDDSEALITTSDDDPYNIKALANQGRFKEILEIKVINESIDQATNGLSCLNCNSRCGLEFSVVNHVKNDLQTFAETGTPYSNHAWSSPNEANKRLKKRKIDLFKTDSVTYINTDKNMDECEPAWIKAVKIFGPNSQTHKSSISCSCGSWNCVDALNASENQTNKLRRSVRAALKEWLE